MDSGTEWGGDLRVLQNKRDATRYRILVEIAERQPAVSQPEVAERLGITAQAVSQYLTELVEIGHVRKLGRGRYEVTPEGIDWLISQTEDLREFTAYVAEEVTGQVDVETAIATGEITTGDQVSLSMADGVLRAQPAGGGPASATAVTDATPGQDVGVTDIEGLVEFEVGDVTVLVIPPIADGGSRAVEADRIVTEAASVDRVAVAGTEAYAAARAAGVAVDLRFGTPSAVQEAAVKGLDVLLLTVPAELSRHTDRLREYDLAFEIIEAES